MRCTTWRAICGRPDDTVIFGVSRALGVLSALTLSRALGLPIERPKSVTTQWLEDKFGKV